MSKYRLVETNRTDGRPFACFRTQAAMLGSERVGTVQDVVPDSGLMRGRDDGRRVAWVGDGTQAGQHLGTFGNVEEALAAIEANQP